MTSDCLMVGNLNMIHSENLSSILSTQQLRLFVGSWNVGGRAPTRETRKSMQEWLMGSSQHPDEPADIYVIGFQETVPLNAGNILGMNFKDGNDAGLLASNKWENLISKTLNKCSSTSWNPGDCIHFDSRAQSTNPAQMETTASTSILPKNASDKNDNSIALFARHNGDNDAELQQYEGGCSVGSANSQCRYNVVEAIADRCGMICMTPLSTAFAEIEPDLHFGASADRYVYTRIARKCMVGLFISVWVRFDLQHDVQTVQVSSVGCGIMNRLGNKGSVSVSLSVHDTRFCFICTHLSSGNKPGDVLRRNSNVNSILQRTRFYGPEKSRSNASLLPNTILAHDLKERKEWEVCLKGGMKEKSALLPPTSIGSTQTITPRWMLQMTPRDALQHGVIASYGTERASSNFHMQDVNRSFPTIALSNLILWLKLNHWNKLQD